MIHDLLAPLQVLTTCIYVVFSGQCAKEYRLLKDRTREAKAFLALAVVFALCALSGYLIPFVEYTVGYRPDWLLWAHVALHAALPAAAAYLVHVGSARAIMRALSSDRD